MKNLKDYFEDLFATPSNTIGMGGISAPTDAEPGSGDIPQSMCIDIKNGKKLCRRRKKFRKHKI